MRVRLVLGVVLSPLVFACNNNDEIVVAEVNGEKILAVRFAERYTKFLRNGGQRDNILLRQKVLNNMINERLIGEACSRQGFDNDEKYRRRAEQIESQALVDAYTKSIAVDTIKAYEPELREEFRNYNAKVRARYLYAETEEAAARLRDSLDHGATFEQLAKGIFDDPGLANNGGDIGFFGWGDMEPGFEEAAYSLPVGQISEPLRMNVGFGIVQVLDRVVVNPLASEMDYANAKVKLERAVLRKKAEKIARRSAYRIVEDLQPRFNESTLQKVMENWGFVVSDNLQTEGRITFKEEIKNRQLVEFANGSWTVEDFLARSMKTMERQRKRVKSVNDLKDFVKGLALREELLSRARRRNIAANDEVRSAIELARQDFLLRRWMSSVRDTVGQSGWPESAMRDVYARFKKEFAYPPEVDVAEILVRTRSEAEELHRKVQRGDKFSDLAAKHSVRLSTAKKGGKIGWGTRAAFGNMSERFFAAEPGDIVGPAFVDPYWGVFKILGKNAIRPKTYDEAKNQIAERLASAKKLEVVEHALSTLRTQARISINNDALANVIINLN